MADTKLSGRLYLSRIDKAQVKKDDKGNKYIYIDVVERREAGKYGDTHYISTWDKDSGKTTYLADLKPQSWKKDGDQTAAAQPAAPADPNRKPLYEQAQTLQPAGEPQDGDLPF